MRAIALGMTLAALAGCDDKSEGGAAAPTRRSDGVAATTTASAEAKATTTPASKPSPKPARKLCVGQAERDPPELPETRRSAEGAAPAVPRYGKGWVWINVWAAWCEPCKEEMPRILAWRNELRQKGVDLELVFVSIDDDEREMTRQLAAQPPDGMRSSFWLPDDEAREPFFAALGYDDTPTLPVHAFVSPQGKVTCLVEGALEPEDHPQVAAIFGVK